MIKRVGKSDNRNCINARAERNPVGQGPTTVRGPELGRLVVVVESRGYDGQRHRKGFDFNGAAGA